MVQRINNVSHLFTKMNRMGPEVLIDMGIRGKMNELEVEERPCEWEKMAHCSWAFSLHVAMLAFE